MFIDHDKKARQAAALISSQTFASLAEAIVPMVMVRFLSMTEVGILSTMVFLYSLAATVFASAFPHSVIYFLPTREPAARGAIARKIAGVMFGFGLVCSGLMLALGTFALAAPETLAGLTDRMVGGTSVVGPSSLKYLVVLALMPLGDFPARMLTNLLVIEDRARTAAAVTAARSLLNLTAILLPILLQGSMWVIVTCYSCSGLLSGLVLLFFLHRLYLDHRRSAPCEVTARQLFAFALPMGINDTVMQLYNRVDLLLIGLFFPALVVAQYRTGAWQIPMITTIAFSVGSVYAPTLRLLFDAGKNREAIAIWKLSITKVALFTAPLGMICIIGAEEIVTLLFTEEYLPAADVFRLYCLLALGRVAAFGPVLVAAGRPGLTVRVAVLSLVGNIFFSIPLLLIFGFIGPALGTVAAFVVHVWGFCWCIARAAGMAPGDVFPCRTLTGILFCTVVPSGVAIWFKLSGYFEPGPTLGGIAVIIVILFAGIASRSGYITKADWRFLRRLPFAAEKATGAR